MKLSIQFRRAPAIAMTTALLGAAVFACGSDKDPGGGGGSDAAREDARGDQATSDADAGDSLSGDAPAAEGSTPIPDAGGATDTVSPGGVVRIAVTPALTPSQATIPSASGGPDRVAARFVGESGVETDFVIDELIISTSSRAKLDGILARWNGKLLGTADTAGAGLTGVTPLYHVQVNPAAIDAAKTLTELGARTPGARGDFRVSSQAALNLLAVALAESEREGITVSPNWILVGMGIPEGTASEAPTGDNGFVNNAFALPYMSRGSTQDIGVGAAWQALAAAGRLSQRVKMMIWDGGFAPSMDFPERHAIFGSSYGTRNPGACSGGTACPWHGTEVVSAAMGRPDNSFGAAGPAGPVGELVAVAAPGSVADWVIALMGGFSATLVGVSAERPRIVNMSFGFGIDWGWEALSALFGPPLGVVMSGVTTAVHGLGTLMFASAGNSPIDVDDGDGSPRGVLHVPCELARVVCVGGLEHDQIRIHPSSSFGSRADDDSVDIYAPFSVWVGPTPGSPDNVARLKHGTSFSSPFVAGVAALVWAAKPSLTQDEVWAIVRDSAHRGGVTSGSGHQRRVNAFGAVQRALNGNVPPFIRIDRPTEGQTLAWRWPASLSATAFDLDDGGLAIVWSSDRDGELGSGANLSTRALSVGAHAITATARAGVQSAATSVNVTVANNPPSVSIRQPAAGASFCTTDSIMFVADVSDANNSPDFPFPPGGIVWSSTPAGLSGTGASIVRMLPAGSYTARVRATDEHSLANEATAPFSVAVCTNNAPVVSITNPADMAGSGPDAKFTPSTSDANGYYQSITLTGSATDTEDGTLSGAALVWTTNRGEVQPGAPASGAQVLGQGASITVKLYTTCGFSFFGTVDHTITLTATDSASNVRSVTRIVRVETIC